MQNLIPPYLRKLKLSSQSRDIPNISEENAVFLTTLIASKKPKNILEIGTANWYSTLHFSSAAPDAQITTIEYAWNMHIEAVEHFKNCKCKNIHPIWWDAKTVIPTLRRDYFDFVFIDAMKREYLDYLLLTLPTMAAGGVIVFDDVEKFRDKMGNLYEFIDKNGIEYTIEKTDSDDSIMVLAYHSFLWKTLLR